MAGMDEFYGGASAVMHRIPGTSQQSSDSGGLPSTPTKRRTAREPSTSTGEADRYFGVGLGLAGLICENVVSHPFIVLRRQCQVMTPRWGQFVYQKTMSYLVVIFHHRST